MCPCLRSLVVWSFCTAMAVAQNSGDAADGRRDLPLDDVAGWTRRMLERPNAAIDQLAARGAACLPLLRELSRTGRENVWRGVARTCERLGPGAAPLQPELLAGLRAPGDWSTHLYAIQALTAIGRPDDTVLDALLDHGITSVAPQLRAAAARGLAVLTADASDRVLGAWRQGRLHDPERAIELLLAFGDAAVPRQVALLQRDEPSATDQELLAEALARRGWQVVRQLERAGFAELAQHALRQGPRQSALGEQFVLRQLQPTPPVSQLPQIHWEMAARGDSSLRLLRAAERPEGYAVARVCLRRDRDGEPSVELDHTVVPRVLAADAVRQLELLATAELQRVAEGDRRSWNLTEPYARVLVERDGRPVLDTCCHGRVRSATVTQRFLAEAACLVLDQLLRDAQWTARSTDDADREQLRRALARDDDEPDVVADLRRLQELLGPRRD